MHVFVTGGSGWVGSAVVPELIGAGHQVTGLARSDAAAEALTRAGAAVQRGTLDDLDALGTAAAASDGVIHLAFKHDLLFSGRGADAADADLRAVETLGEALAGSERPLVIAHGLAGQQPGIVSTELDESDADAVPRMRSEHLVLELAHRGVRSTSLRLPPSVHGEGDHGFVAVLVGIARERGVAGYVGDGTNRWPGVHRSDAARLFRLAVESAPAGSVLHAVDDEGVPIRAVAEAIGAGLGLPVTAIAPAAAEEHFGWLGGFVGLDVPSSSALTRERTGWAPSGPGLLADLEAGHYFA